MGKAGVVAVKGGGSALKSSTQRSASPRKRGHRPSHGRPRDLLLASGDPIFLAPAGRLAAISRFLAAAPPRSIAPLAARDPRFLDARVSVPCSSRAPQVYYPG